MNCSKCGRTLHKLGYTCLSNPPKIAYSCETCGNVEYQESGTVTGSHLDCEFWDRKLQAPMNTGWVCPLCGRVYSPMVTTCDFCGESKTITISYATNTLQGEQK